MFKQTLRLRRPHLGGTTRATACGTHDPVTLGGQRERREAEQDVTVLNTLFFHEWYKYDFGPLPPLHRLKHSQAYFTEQQH